MNISLGKFKERGILMKVYQIRIKLYLLKDIMAQDVQIMLTRFIDKSLFAKENYIIQIHIKIIAMIYYRHWKKIKSIKKARYIL